MVMVDNLSLAVNEHQKSSFGIGLGKVIAERNTKSFVHIRVKVVIPAKIVLTSTLKEALEPIKYSRLRKTTKKPVENMDGRDPEG